jgi:hypothetical protein
MEFFLCAALVMVGLLDFLIPIILMANIAKVHCQKDDLATRNFQHYMKFQSFICKEPQPRLLPVEELFDVNSKDLYTPRATVLHRCGEDTGCCPTQSMFCAPQEVDNVTLIFKVYDTQNSTPSIQERQVTNHTLCLCVESE